VSWSIVIGSGFDLRDTNSAGNWAKDESEADWATLSFALELCLRVNAEEISLFINQEIIQPETILSHHYGDSEETDWVRNITLQEKLLRTRSIRTLEGRKLLEMQESYETDFAEEADIQVFYRNPRLLLKLWNYYP